MPRILYWNIETFSHEKIAPATKKRSAKDRDYGSGSPGPDRLAMILSTLQPTGPGGAAAPLDFIVVVEVAPGGDGRVEGQLVDGNAQIAVTALHGAIQGALAGGANWCLVPPVITGAGGRREAVAVFYNSAAWYFLGPWRTAAAYPAAWRAMLPGGLAAARVIPAGYPYDTVAPAARQENRSLGQFQFLSGPPPVGMAPAPPLVDFPVPGYRRPWLTAFGAVGAPGTLVRIMAMHTTPNDDLGHVPWADMATANIANCWDVTVRAPDAPTQTDVILGDFNVDNLNPANFAAGGPFGRLLGHAGGGPAVAPAYDAAIEIPAGLLPAYQSYYHTLGRPAYDGWDDRPARIADDNDFPPPNVNRAGDYPGMRYSIRSLDNVLVRRHFVPMPPVPLNTSILARARQVPYTAPLPAPMVPPMLGHYERLAYMDDTIGGLINHWNGMTPVNARAFDINETFREWGNYGLVRSVSDHFAIVVDV